ncbi:MAG: hypothetical protein E7526_00335 [Ruminococcaceae bacterium]|nr:hypothetical protein [Oscillospiraceae bacterium]
MINQSILTNNSIAINSFFAIEQAAINSTVNITNSFMIMCTAINSQISATQILSDAAFSGIFNNAIIYSSIAVASIISGITTLYLLTSDALLLINADTILSTTLISSSFINAFALINIGLLSACILIGGTLKIIDAAFKTTAENAETYFENAANSIKDDMKIIEEASVTSTQNSSDGWIDCFSSASKTIGTISDGLDIYTNLKDIFGKTRKAGSSLTQILNINTGVQTTNTIATASAGATASSASLSVLAFGGGVMAMGTGVLLAGMALALLAKTVFNFLKLSGLSTNGVKASDFDLSFSVPGLATGGFPSMGQMFIAREAGPELVGTIGSRNAVVNNDQIVESVSAGVYKAVREAMNGGQANGQKAVITLDKRVLGEFTIGYINGKTKETGLSPILV